MSDIKPWLERVLTTNSQQEIYTLLDEFRPLIWSDEERANMAKVYNAKLYQLNTNQNTENSKTGTKESKTKTSSEISKQDAGNQRGESTSSNQEVEEDEIL